MMVKSSSLAPRRKVWSSEVKPTEEGMLMLPSMRSEVPERVTVAAAWPTETALVGVGPTMTSPAVEPPAA